MHNIAFYLFYYWIEDCLSIPWAKTFMDDKALPEIEVSKDIP